MARSRTIGYLIALVILIMMYFPDVLDGGRIFVERDLPVFFYPWIHFLKAPGYTRLECPPDRSLVTLQSFLPTQSR